LAENFTFPSSVSVVILVVVRYDESLARRREQAPLPGQARALDARFRGPA
jgi:hypothetical protein